MKLATALAALPGVCAGSLLLAAVAACESSLPRSAGSSPVTAEPVVTTGAAPESVSTEAAPPEEVTPAAPPTEARPDPRPVEAASPESARPAEPVAAQEQTGPKPLAQRGRIPEEALPISPRRERTQPGTALAESTQLFRPPFGERELLAKSEAVWRSRRSFDGAPPVLPHSANYGSGKKTCLDCHRAGMAIGNRVAHPMSHLPLTSCLQCHVEAKSSAFPEDAEHLRVPNGFQGVRVEEQGQRAFEGAPPMIPHTLRMRQNCLACHGKFGWPGIRIDHSQRGNCVQCHLTERAEPNASE